MSVKWQWHDKLDKNRRLRDKDVCTVGILLEIINLL